MNRISTKCTGRDEPQIYERFERAYIVVIGIGSSLFLIDNATFYTIDS